MPRFAANNLAVFAAASALHLLGNRQAAAALGCEPAEYLVQCGFFTAMAAFMRRPQPACWNGGGLIGHRYAGHTVAAAAGQLEVWCPAAAPQPSDALVSGVAACSVANLRRIQQPLPQIAAKFKEAELEHAMHALWTFCNVLCGMLRRPQWRRHALEAGAVPATVLALRWVADSSDWAAFAKLLAMRAPRLAGELLQQLDAVAAAVRSQGNELQDGVDGGGVGQLLLE